jgi:hypothetical protein
MRTALMPDCGADVEKAIMSKNGHYCPVCGWKGLEAEPIHPYGTFEICSCCGTEFGLDVVCDEDILEVRVDWLKAGALWFSDFDKPVDWSMERALGQIKDFLGCERDSHAPVQGS